jgi:hypothetical protein
MKLNSRQQGKDERLYVTQGFQSMVDTKLIKAFIYGFLTFIPGVTTVLRKRKKKSTHSGSSAEFCYALWLSLLVFFKENGVKPELKRIGEIGNGGSFGVGFCAILSGSEEYYALDIEEIFDKDQNLKLLDDIVLLFKKRTAIPNKFNVLNIKINKYEYPEDLINPLFLQKEIISEIRNDILNGFKGSNRIRIIMNWHISNSLNLDFVFSRAVMEHVFDPNVVYGGIYSQLNQNAYMFHDIELHSHGITKKIDGHYHIPTFVWRIIFGKRTYMLNRWDLEKHLVFIVEAGFKVLKTQKNLIKDQERMALNGAVILAQKR